MNESPVHKPKCFLIWSGRNVCLDLLSIMTNLTFGVAMFWLWNPDPNDRVIFINQLKSIAMSSSLVMQILAGAQ
jgi:hypothetical protein